MFKLTALSEEEKEQVKKEIKLIPLAVFYYVEAEDSVYLAVDGFPTDDKVTKLKAVCDNSGAKVIETGPLHKYVA